ncbi:SOS response-associated peptidase [Geothrix campi]|uniref:SOS response-associated peptidase n=1 Tax=Geothrix campi TaxID=2966450 RepID=UPI0021483E80
MCGRVGVKKGIEGLVLEHLGAAGAIEDWAVPNANVSPTNAIPGVRLVDGARVAGSYMWGFMPPNAPSRGFISEYFTFNARADKIATGRLYSKPFKSQRCLIVVNAWYEWPKAPGARKGTPRTIIPATGDLFVFAGLWGPWTDPETGVGHDTATVITTEPNELIAELPHHRMPAILAPSEWAAWLDPATPVEGLLSILRPCPSGWLEARQAGPTNFSLD